MTAAGQTFEHFVDAPLGRDREHPLPAGALEGKFRDCAGMVLDADSAETLLQLCGDLDSVANVADVVEIVERGAAGPAPDALRVYA